MNDDKMSDAGRSVHTEQFGASEKEKRVALLDKMIRDFDNMIVSLDEQIATEEDRTMVKDPAHPAYSTLAVVAAKRRQNLLISLSQVRSIREAELREPVLAANSPPMVSEVPSL